VCPFCETPVDTPSSLALGQRVASAQIEQSVEDTFDAAAARRRLRSSE
jgi:hypothetical protein